MSTMLPLSSQIYLNLTGSAIAAALIVVTLLFFSVRDHTRTGPRVKEEIAQHYSYDLLYALLRLGAWGFTICFFLASAGASLYFLTLSTWELSYRFPWLLLCTLLAVVVTSTFLFCHHLLHTPSLLLSSVRFRFSRLMPLWRQLSPQRLRTLRWLILLLAMGIVLPGLYQLLHRAQWGMAFFYALQAGLYYAIYTWVTASTSMPAQPAPKGSKQTPPSIRDKKPNLLMIGSDTLRADRLGCADYIRNLSPQIDQLAEQSITFSNCYTPLARTAPSLASMLTGTWPHNHGIRTNYPYDEQLNLPVDNLIQSLNRAGYNTTAVADWAGADLGKIDFGFKQLNLPQDQWNLKYLLRQGPAGIRLFLSLFCHNRFGKKFLPELYYLAGIPLTKQLFSDTRTLISEMADKEEPFCINLFTATTHVPFGSNYPYYDMFTPDDYAGDSQFIMTKLATPEEIIEKQELGPEAFDVPQILNLYDGCVVQFDDEVGKLLAHLKDCGLDDNTIVVIYSDHGADFFETGSWGQGNTLMGDDPSGRIPLIVHDPRQKQAHVVEQTVRSIDIAPTLLELLALTPLKKADGQSLVAAMNDPAAKLDLLAYQETGLWLGRVPGAHPQHLDYPNLLELLDIPDKKSGMLCIKPAFYSRVVKAKDRSVRNDRWKLIAMPTKMGVVYRLYDLQKDPDCNNDVATSEAEVFGTLKNQLDALIAEDPLMHNTMGNTVKPSPLKISYPLEPPPDA
ncbi:MAG: sulfatase-like hydrolase/transferase [Porticoccaceae bacterium]|nr:sulfatase-like hydrolase/transferase [Porticoccaceae bacterium]